jgi:hypothetical protein
MIGQDKEIKGFTFDDKWKEFINVSPQWDFTVNDVDNYLFWLDPKYSHLKNLKILRQDWGGRYFGSRIAPITFLHYHSCSKTNGTLTGIIDLSHYISKTRGDQLGEQLLGTEKDDPVEFVTSIVGKKANLHTDQWEYSQYDLLRHGPGLVWNFQVFEEFYWNCNKVPLFRKLSAEERKRGIHALVMIGFRRTYRGEVFFLLQNSWTDCFFIEVSEKYLKGCNAKLTFWKDNEQWIPKDLPPMNEFQVAECCDFTYTD